MTLYWEAAIESWANKHGMTLTLTPQKSIRYDMEWSSDITRYIQVMDVGEHIGIYSGGFIRDGDGYRHRISGMKHVPKSKPEQIESALSEYKDLANAIRPEDFSRAPTQTFLRFL